MRIGIIGGGKVGRCLASYLGKSLVGITANSLEHSRQLAATFATEPCTNKELVERAEVLLLTVPDRLIGTVAEQLASEATAMAGAQAPLAGKTFLHCSGSMGLEELAPLQRAGAHVGSLHPLQSFAGGATQLAGVYMAVDGD